MALTRAPGPQSPINVVDQAGATKTAVYDATLGALAFNYPSTSTYKIEMNGAHAQGHAAG